MCPKPVEACSLSTHYACIYNFEYIYSGWGLRNSHNTQVPNISMETSWVIWSKHIKRLNLLNRIWMDFFLCNVYGWIVHQIFVHYPALNLINIQAQKSKHTTPPLLGYPRIKGKSSWAHHATNLWKMCDNYNQKVLYFYKTMYNRTLEKIIFRSETILWMA